MCSSPIQYSRDFILEIKEGKKSNVTQSVSLIKSLITDSFLDNLKILKNVVYVEPVSLIMPNDSEIVPFDSRIFLNTLHYIDSFHQK